VTHLKRRDRASKLRRQHNASLPQGRRRVCALLQPPSGSARAGAHSPVRGVSVPRKKASAQHRHPAPGRDTVLLHEDENPSILALPGLSFLSLNLHPGIASVRRIAGGASAAMISFLPLRGFFADIQNSQVRGRSLGPLPIRLKRGRMGRSPVIRRRLI
jgi:hypothetical protein